LSLDDDRSDLECTDFVTYPTPGAMLVKLLLKFFHREPKEDDMRAVDEEERPQQEKQEND